jgi:histidyl-tRNA synthetase
LGIPFKRYHIATVWRGENTQRGRYREFMQCDFDTIGTRSVAADIETVLVIHDLMRAIGFTKFQILINNRMLLTGLLERFDLVDRAVAVLRVLDKLNKIGPDAVADELISSVGTTLEQAQQIVRLSEISGSNDEILRQVQPLVETTERGQEGLDRLDEVLSGVKAGGVPESQVRLHLSIARGLDYYTGMVFETYLNDLPSIGSVCSGGRFDNLAELFTAQELPGIGASLGLDRLLAAMEELHMIEKVATTAPVFIPYFDASRLHEYLKLAAVLRAAGIGVEVYPDAKKLGQQLKYADRRGFRIALIAGADEFAVGPTGICQVKDLQTATQQDVPLEPDALSLIKVIQDILQQQ